MVVGPEAGLHGEALAQTARLLTRHGLIAVVSQLSDDEADLAASADDESAIPAAVNTLLQAFAKTQRN